MLYGDESLTVEELTQLLEDVKKDPRWNLIYQSVRNQTIYDYMEALAGEVINQCENQIVDKRPKPPKKRRRN